MRKSYGNHGEGRITLAEVQIWGVLAIGFAYWGNVIRTGWDPDALVLLGISQSILGNGAFAVGAWIAIVMLTLRTTLGSPAPMRVSLATIAACLPVILPSEQTVMLGMLALGTLRFRSHDSVASRTIALLLFALAGNLFWTSSYLLPLHAWVGMFDARVVTLLLQLGGISADSYANLVINQTDNSGLEVLAQCASSFPLSGICLGFIVTVVCLGQPLRRHDLGWLMASLLVSVALTEVRLLWMALSQEDYLWLHDGSGQDLYSLAAVLLATVFPLLAARAGGGSRHG